MENRRKDGMMNYIHEYRSPIGKLTLASDGENVTGLWVEGQKYHGATLGGETIRRRLGVLDDAAAWLDEYFGGREPSIALPLAPAGTPFRRRVWKILREIPYGTVTTYAEISRKLTEADGKPSTAAARAVGGAVGHNPISIIIPCHRVVGSDGGLTGFAGGVDKKRLLLRLERSDPATTGSP